VWQRERLVGKIDNKPGKVPGSHIDGFLATSAYLPTTDVVCHFVKLILYSLRIKLISYNYSNGSAINIILSDDLAY